MNLSDLKGTTVTAIRRDRDSLLVDFSNGCQLMIGTDLHHPRAQDYAQNVFYGPHGEMLTFDPEEVPDLWPFLSVVIHA